MDIVFKNWGKLEAVGASKLLTAGKGGLYEKIDRVIAPVLPHLPVSYGSKRILKQKIYGLKNRLSTKFGSEHVYSSDALFLEIGNPGSEDISINLILRNTQNAQRFFQKQLILTPGYNTIKIETEQISNMINLDAPYRCSIDPIGENEPVRLLFGVMDFVKFKSVDNASPAVGDTSWAKSHKLKKAKCVIWDLDNTLWKGVLIEDGVENLQVDQNVIKLIYEFDKMGILNSVASKNNPDDALPFLKQLGLEELFLYPQVSWGPKSQAISNIQQSLNIGMDTLIFIDDQPFEREEVSSRHPQVRTFDVADIEVWRNNPAFDIEVSSESSKRREMYQDQIVREENFEKQDSADYESFLRDCKIVVKLEHLSKNTIRRAYELAQRTNQMNFSGTRYSMSQLQGFLTNNDIEATIIRCNDRFGDYGIVGLAVLNTRSQVIDDLMFSCRIQSKFVDKAVLTDFVSRIGPDLNISFKPTAKNIKPAEVFGELGFVVKSETDGVQILYRSENSMPLNNDIVELHHVSARSDQ
ncbi:MAG: HAD-IIIC family phosphatase [Rhizobiaceae bacterium]